MLVVTFCLILGSKQVVLRKLFFFVLILTPEDSEDLVFCMRTKRSKLFEPRHDKKKQNGCAPSEDSDQPGHPPSLIRVFAVCSMGAKDPSFLQADSEDSDQTGRMPRVI